MGSSRSRRLLRISLSPSPAAADLPDIPKFRGSHYEIQPLRNDATPTENVIKLPLTRSLGLSEDMGGKETWVRYLGKGGSGTVIVGTHRLTGKKHAIKIIPKPPKPPKSGFKHDLWDWDVDYLRQQWKKEVKRMNLLKRYPVFITVHLLPI